VNDLYDDVDPDDTFDADDLERPYDIDPSDRYETEVTP